MKRACILAVFFLLVSGYALGQGGGNAAITGTVTDPADAVVPSAKVTVTQKSTGVVRSATTNANGAFNVPSLPPDTYTITIEASGFKKYVQTVTLLADQERAFDVRLELGQASQQVTVEASSVMVNTVSPVLSQVLEQSRVVNLPLNGRNAADLTLLVPGTTSANGHGVQQGNTKQIPGAESI
ncbi:MAG TPA: carboxypeptidase-like regulatory domain-containing protein, partial [Candidatus Udaeobacter sp.]|nr:carboxypeptidase-like regulatory domain-containing protein [Candidatus Udaeobacter sp.]